MKVKPYRRCDICESDYLKLRNCMKIKCYRFADDYGGFSKFEKFDVCPVCADKMIKGIRTQRWESEQE